MPQKPLFKIGDVVIFKAYEGFTMGEIESAKFDHGEWTYGVVVKSLGGAVTRHPLMEEEITLANIK